MSSIFDSARNLLNNIQSKASSVSKSLNFDPTSNGGQNFWSTPVAQGLGKVQSYFESPQATTPFPTFQVKPNDNLPMQIGKSVANIPSDLGNTIIGKGILAPSYDLGTNIGKTLTGQPLTPYNQLQSPITRLGYQIAGAYTPPNNVDRLKQTAGNLAGIAEPILSAYLPKGVENLAVKPTLMEALLSGAKSGAKFGGTFGAISGLSQNRDTKNNGEYALRVLGTTAGGAGMGALIGAGTSWVAGLIDKIIASKNPGMSIKEVQTARNRYLVDESGKFRGSVSQKKEPVYYGDIREAFGMPRTGLTANDIPLGLSVKQITPAERASLVEKPMSSVGDIIQKRNTDIPPLTQTEGQLQPKSSISSTSPIARSETQAGTISGAGPGNLPPSSEGIVPQSDKYAFNINKNRLNIPEVNKSVIDSTVRDILPELQQAKGAKLSNQEVIQAAQTSDVLKRVVTRDETKAFNAALLKTRQAVSAGASGKGISQDFIDALKVQSSIASDWGRRGNALSIGADPILNEPVKNQVVQKLLDLGKTTDEIVKASEGVDFNNPKQVTAFYRQFVKPNAGEILNEYRYINLLSSPKTHITNAFSNLLQAAVVDPGTKLFTGATDLIGSTITGKQRQNYVGEVKPYFKGMLNSLGEATQKMADAFKGNAFTERPDVSRLPTGSKLTAPFQSIPRALEASDAFFRTLISGAEKESLAYKYTRMGKNISEAKLNQMADDRASYFVFRKALDPSNKSGQGALLSNIDKLTQSVYTLRKVPGVSWFIPFVQTPMNILKQGIEYSPLGVGTIPGAANKTEQIGKALLGSTVFAGAAYAVQAGDSTWSAPTSNKDKEAFYASGRQPYSIKVGDQWVSYSRLGPLAYPIAMAAAIKYYTQQDPKTVTRSKLDSVGRTVAGMAKFFSDQSYVQGLGDLVKTLQGDPTAAKQLITGIPSQMIPLESLVGWVARIVDPIYRQPSSITDSLKTQIPFLSKTVAPYTNPAGLPSERQNVLFNAFSPVGVTPNTQYNNLFLNKMNSERYTNVMKNVKDNIKTGDTKGALQLIKDNRSILNTGGKANVLINKTSSYQDTRDKIMKAKIPQDQKTRLLKLLEKQILQTNSIGVIK